MDFIVRMKNGQVFLFDTKTRESDRDAANKHNALIDYMDEPTNKALHLKGGVLIESRTDVWRFCPAKIDGTGSTEAWEAFFPAEYVD